MIGKRIQQGKDGGISLRPGEYGKQGDRWVCVTPNGHWGSLKDHQVEEHKDGTITVSPSILVTEGVKEPKELYHGYLKKGVWSTA